jgi:hypothetical protein
LQVEQLGVHAASRDQLVVGAVFDHPTVLQHHDQVGRADGREAVRDEQGYRALGGGQVEGGGGVTLEQSGRP